jgi:hypothetical protein
MIAEGANGHRTRIIVAYQPSSHKLDIPSKLLTVYRKQAKFLRKTQKDKTCPRKLFRDQLISALATWRKEGYRLILFIDANDCLTSGKFVTQLQQQVDMDDLVKRQTGKDGTPTYIKGEKEGSLKKKKKNAFKVVTTI